MVTIRSIHHILTGDEHDGLWIVDRTIPTGTIGAIWSFHCANNLAKEKIMTIGTILIIVLILILIGALPSWGYSSSWGYGPSGGLGLILVIIIILVLLGKI
jgi:hypothetical protein